MLKSVRYLPQCALAVVLILIGQVAVFGQDQANTSQPKSTKSTSTKSKKRKKKKTSSTSFIILGSPNQAASVVEVPATATFESPVSQPAAPTIRAEKSSGLKISPKGSVPPPGVATAGQIIISEFRVRGSGGATDEFIEIYNASGSDHTVSSAGSGYAVAASDGVARCVIPNGTVIPNRGHYLCANSVGYSLASYPAGNGTTATADATYTTDIPDNAGVAIFNVSNPVDFILANRLDAVGSTSEANTLYKEGTGYSALSPFSIDYSFVRDLCGKQGSITTFGPCTANTPVDTDNNATNFFFVDTNAFSAGAGQRLGAPGPENLSSPIQRNASVSIDLLDPCAAAAAPPNRVRDFTPGPSATSQSGTLDIRRTLTNNTGGNVTRLRFRIIDLTTFPNPSGIADLRPLTSPDVAETVDRAPCGSGTSSVTVRGTTLETPPTQPNGGGFNSSLSSNTVTLATPLANGATIDVRFLLGIQQTGSFKIYFNTELLP